jgi:hypothetical protein
MAGTLDLIEMVANTVVTLRPLDGKVGQFLHTHHVSTADLLGAGGLLIVSVFSSMALVSFVLVRLPVDYFQIQHSVPFWPRRPQWQRWIGLVGKNCLGVVLMVAGILMAVPGVPGQGILIVLMGMMLLDIPGKRRWEQKIVRNPRVFRSINHLRKKFGKPPLVNMDDNGTPPSSERIVFRHPK